LSSQMLKREGVRKVNKELSKLFKKYNIVFAYLFGSQATGKTGLLSDIDIAVYFDKKVFQKDYFDLRLELIGGLMDIFRRDDIDIVVLNEAPYVLENKILREGKFIYSRDEKARNAYETKAFINYFDWDYFEEKFTKAILEN